MSRPTHIIKMVIGPGVYIGETLTNAGGLTGTVIYDQTDVPQRFLGARNLIGVIAYDQTDVPLAFVAASNLTGSVSYDQTDVPTTEGIGTITQDPDPSPYGAPVDLVFSGTGLGVSPAVRSLEGDIIDDTYDPGTNRLTITAEYTYQDITVEVYDSAGVSSETKQVTLILTTTSTAPESASGGGGSFGYDQTDVPLTSAASAPDPATDGGGSFGYDQTDVPVGFETATDLSGSATYDQTDVPTSTVPSAASGGGGSFAYDQTDVPTV